MRGGGEGCGASANEYSCAHGAHINLGDLTPYITYVFEKSIKFKIHQDIVQKSLIVSQNLQNFTNVRINDLHKYSLLIYLIPFSTNDASYNSSSSDTEPGVSDPMFPVRI
jgi:hypothetical protein